ncbi:TetR/AcrR family transcriptional regulator [Streptomyces sp. NPDC048332]|uniref:TetR/AcrR family transcriptional regulator n=1 Tax=Streptomyces sp. NPDC048332 TaxID=3154619 RepID=UPI00343CB58E
MPTSQKRPAKPSGIRAPKQERSQRSFELVLDTTLELLAEQGFQGFSLTEVSRRSKVSVGAIYTRVDGKDDVLRAAQERFQEQFSAEQRELLRGDRWEGQPLAGLLPELIEGFVRLLERRGKVLGAFMQLGAVDETVARVGKVGYFDLRDRFTALLLERRDEIRHPDPERAVRSCFVTVYATLARAMALDVAAEAAEAAGGDGDLSALVEDLGGMTLSFLCFDRSSGS